MTKAISLVVDTNLFFECKVLEEIAWGELGYDEVELLVTQPVQSEIDKHKKNPSGRTYDRALKFFKLFRSMLAEKREEVVRVNKPRVTLQFAHGVRPDKSHEDHLDYSKNDDAMVGCLSELVKRNPQKQYALLTHDTGPTLTAQSIDLEYIFIPDSWLLPAQQDSKTKEINRLKGEIKHLQSQEPQIEIVFYDATDKPIKQLDCERTIYTALEEEKIDRLIEKIQQRFPEDRDFGSEATTPKPLSQRLLGGMSQWEFTAATHEEIEKYREDYEQWLEECRKVLSTLHTTLNHQDYPYFMLTASNVGTRPAASTLIEFNMDGNIQFFEEPDEDEEDKPIYRRVMTCSPPALPAAPKAPKGNWKAHRISRGFEDMMRGISGLGLGSDHHLMRAMMPNHDFRLYRDLTPPKRDPNAFYWKGDRPDVPLTHTSLTCEQWRHSSKERYFEFSLDIPKDKEEREISGLFTCMIHAENLTEPAEARLPIKITTVEASCEDKAAQLVEDFIAIPAFALKLRQD